MSSCPLRVALFVACGLAIATVPTANGLAADLPAPAVEGQPLAANAARLLESLESLGSSVPENEAAEIKQAANKQDAAQLQKLLDSRVMFAVSLSKAGGMKVTRGPAEATLQQGGFTPTVVKVMNAAAAKLPLKITSPQDGAVYSGASLGSLTRQQQTELNANENTKRDLDRFLSVEMHTAAPMADKLSGLEVEYVVALVYSSVSGKREAKIGFELASGEKEKPPRAETALTLDIRPAVPVKLSILDDDGSPTVGRLIFRDAHGRVYPPQPKRLAPDFFFQPQIYRKDGDVVLLPPGEFTLQASRGPEYRVVERKVHVPAKSDAQLDVKLARWVNPQAHGFFGGDHHIHAAGCAHYTSPTEGVRPEDMFLQVKGEGLNVGCVLTWGPCYLHQRQFFAPAAHELSDPRTLLKYDLEISGFGSQQLGHVCLLNLKDQTYPGSEGTATKGWPTWTTPVMRWAKEQGGFTGYAHSASGLAIDPVAAAKRLLAALDSSGDSLLSPDEAAAGLLPEPFAKINADRNGTLNILELIASHERAADQLPNLAIPEMNGVGAMEICVSTSEGVCDFISAMDTARIQEWNTWYHLLNCGFPLKASGETDFPCMSSRNVGQGRVYVQLGKPERLDFAIWCQALAKGRSYVSDGYAHALEFTADGVSPGFGDVALREPGKITVKAKVAFAEETPLAVAHGGVTPAAGRRVLGDTVVLHVPRIEKVAKGGQRLVELVVNGQAVASQNVPADNAVHEISFTTRIEQSSWVALRHFPQFHTNPVNVMVAEKPIRAARSSALWCVGMTELLWKNREKAISPPEREAAKAAFDKTLARFRQIAGESTQP